MAGWGGRWFAVCGVGLLATTALGLAIPHPVPGQFGIGYGAALDGFVAIEMIQGAIYAGAVYMLLKSKMRPDWRVVLGLGCLLRLMVLVFPPFLSNDMYRYIWDGWVQGAGINPYRYIPDDSHLVFLRDAMVFPNINRADYAHTIYPPAAEMVFFAVAMLGKILHLPPVFFMKCGMLACEGAGIWGLLKLLDASGQPRRRILIYVLNPLPIWEFASSGHVDAIAVGLVALALAAAATGRGKAGAALLAAAALTKFLPAVLWPAIWRRWDWRLAAIFGGVICLLYAPYLGVGLHVFGFLGGYVAQEHIAGGQGLFWLDLLATFVPLGPLAAKLYLGLLAAGLLGLGAVMLRAKRPQGPAGVKLLARNCLLIAGVLLLGISPHYPWYFAFLLVPACIMPSMAALYLVTASPLLYLNPTHTALFWPALVFIPAALLAARHVFNIWPVSQAGAEGAEI